MLEYVVKLNDSPGDVGAADAQRLRDAGFDDEGIIDVVMMCSLFNFMNRLADGLGPIANPNFEQNKEKRDRKFDALFAKDASKAG